MFFSFCFRFRLLWLDKFKPEQVKTVRKAMETAIKTAMKEDTPAAVSTADKDTSGSSDEGSDEDLFADITSQDTMRTGSVRKGRSLKGKAQALVETWLDSQSKMTLDDATFLGEPILVKLFVKYNTAMPSSAAVEWLFSMGKDILRAKRAALSDANFEMLMFLKGNMHLKLDPELESKEAKSKTKR